MTLSHNLESRCYVRKWLGYPFVELLLATLDSVVAVPADTKSGHNIIFITLVFFNTSFCISSLEILVRVIHKSCG